MNTPGVIIIAISIIASLLIWTARFLAFRMETRSQRPSLQAIVGIVLISFLTIIALIGGIVALVNPGASRSMAHLVLLVALIANAVYVMIPAKLTTQLRLMMVVATVGIIIGLILDVIDVMR